MSRVILYGALGRMGRTVTEAAGQNPELELIRVDRSGLEGCCKTLEEAGSADVLIDFSNHAATDAVLNFCLARRLPAVLAATGHTDAELRRIRSVAGQIPIFKATNLSVGVAVLTELVKLAAAAFPAADTEIVETHHNRKQDAPSGTALSLAQAVQAVRGGAFCYGRQGHAPRQAGEIGIHALRLGNVPGTHEVYFDTGAETLVLTHRAQDRSIFAQGALRAAAFILGKAPGLYGMPDLLADLRKD